MATLTITKSYADGQLLAEADLDSFKSSIETFLNTTKINDDNIQDLGISPGKIDIDDDETLAFGTGNDLTIGVAASDDATIQNVTEDKDIILQVNDGGATTEVARCDGDTGTFNLVKGKIVTNNLDANSLKITNLAAPTSDNDAARKKYVDDQISGIASPTTYVHAYGGTGWGSTDTKIRRFTSVDDNGGSDITHATSAANGDTFTIDTAGIYMIVYGDEDSLSRAFGISKNSGNLTTNVSSLTYPTEALEYQTTGGSPLSAVWVGQLAATDVIRAHGEGAGGGSGNQVSFRIMKMGSI